MTLTRLTILGARLTTAQGHAAQLYERDNSPGGRTHSICQDGFVFDVGAIPSCPPTRNLRADRGLPQPDVLGRVGRRSVVSYRRREPNEQILDYIAGATIRGNTRISSGDAPFGETFILPPRSGQAKLTTPLPLITCPPDHTPGGEDVMALY